MRGEDTEKVVKKGNCGIGRERQKTEEKQEEKTNVNNFDTKGRE